MRESESRSGRSHSWKAGDRQRFGGRGHLAGQLAAGGEGAVCWSEKNLGPNLSRVLGSSRDPLPSPRQHSLHRVLAATWNCSSFSVCSWVRSRSSGAAILPPPLRFWPVRTVTRRKWPQQHPHPVWTAAGAQLRLRMPAQPRCWGGMEIVIISAARGRLLSCWPRTLPKIVQELCGQVAFWS